MESIERLGAEGSSVSTVEVWLCTDCGLLKTAMCRTSRLSWRRTVITSCAGHVSLRRQLSSQLFILMNFGASCSLLG